VPHLTDEPLTQEKFLEEMLCYENRVDSKISEVKSLFRDLEAKQKFLEEKVMTHVIEDEVSHVEEDVEQVKSRMYDPEKGIIVMQQSICGALEKLHEALVSSDKLFKKALKKQAKESAEFRQKMNTKMAKLQKTIWIVAACGAGIYLIDNPEVVFSYLVKAFAIVF
jgi:predicted nuclease with TOPRIM domain